jgi:SAM-dependent methyltransferase
MSRSADEWSIRIDGSPADPPGGAAASLERIASSARSVLGEDARLFARIDRFGGTSVAYAGAARGHVAAGGEGGGRDPREAVESALGALAGSLAQAPAAIPRLGDRLPVGDVLLEHWRVPSGACGFEARLESLLDQRFLHHLSDEEALARAELAGRAFFIYGARGRREHRLLVRIGTSWRLAVDVERPIWRLATGAANEVDVVTRRPGDSDGELHRSRFDGRHVISAPTLDAALDAVDERRTFVALAHVASLGRMVVLVKSDPAFVSIVGYETDAYRTRESTGAFGVPVWAAPSPPPPSKAARIASALSCPQCRQDLRADAARREQACARCGFRFAVDGGVFDFMHGGRGAAAGDESASRNPPSKQLLHELRLHPSGLVLNAGAGDTPLRAENLVNLEIVRYPNTDVVADGQRLPFRDATFDMVFSQSVVEHVPDPFAHARELIRVLKPGDTILADAPFVAPFHGYPDHYFNPTMNGLRVLLRGIEEIEVREGSHHDPSIALLSILSAYVRLVRDPDARQRLLQLRVGDLLDQIRTGQNPEVLRDLDPGGTFEISSGFAFYGRKRAD